MTHVFEATGGSPGGGLEILELLEAHPDRVYGIPTLGPVRSLNLSNAVAIVVYQALSRIGALAEPFLADDALGDR